MNIRTFAFVALLATAASSQANLIANGGFDDTVVSGPFAGSGYQIYGAGSHIGNGTGSVGGWLVGGDTVDLTNTLYPFVSPNNALDLNGTPGPGSITQTFTSTANSFVVSFYALSNEQNQTVSVILNGATVATLGTNVVGGIGGSYSLFSYTVFAPGTAGSNSITFSIAPGLTNGNTFIDDISVTAVPGPAAAAAFALGALRRRKRA